MNFTDSPFEKMMKQKPRSGRPEKTPKTKPGSPCYGCSFWRGAACIGTCYRDLTSGNMETRQSQAALPGKEEQRSGADFGPSWPEVAERSLQRRGPKPCGGRKHG